MNKEKFRYAIMKEIEKGNSCFDEKIFEVEEEVFDDNVNFLKREMYIEGVRYYDDRPHFDGCVYLTEKGEKFIEQNNSWSKLYKGLKEFKSWIFI
jgi:CRISPR/Cas system-associated exonuclease Cas4 (RecB family)